MRNFIKWSQIKEEEKKSWKKEALKHYKLEVKCEAYEIHECI